MTGQNLVIPTSLFPKWCAFPEYLSSWEVPVNFTSILPLQEAVSSILIHRQRSWVNGSKQCNGLHMWCESELTSEFQFPLYQLQNHSSSWALPHWRMDIQPHGWRDTWDSQASSRSFSCFCKFWNCTCPVQWFFSLTWKWGILRFQNQQLYNYNADICIYLHVKWMLSWCDLILMSMVGLNYLLILGGGGGL